jgi:hypothetical protein
MQKLFFISCFVLVAFAGFSQTPTFTFECFCGTLTAADTTCDICNTSTQSRYFKGLLIRKNGVAFRWIEEPYTVIQNFNALTFRELIPNAEQIRIELSGTQWTTIEGFRDSVQCPCSGGGSVTLIPGPGISIYGDTIAVIPQQIDTFDIVGVDTLRISIDRDSVPFHFVILPPGVDTSGYNYSFEIVGDSLCVTDGSGTFCVDVSQFLDNTDTSGYNLAFAISGDTLRITDADGFLFVDLSGYLDNTDTSGFNTSLYISGDTLYIQDDNSTKAVSLAPYINTDTDNQNLSYAPASGIMSISGGTGDTIPVMAGATAGTDGERGLVGKPSAGDEAKFWRADGTWSNPSTGGDNWGTQVVQVTARILGNGTGGSPLDIAQQGATSGQVLKWNGTTWAPANDNDTAADGSETVVTAGTGIGVSGSGTSGSPYVVTNTGDLSSSNELQNLTYAPSTGIMSISSGTGDTVNVMVGATSGTNGERGLVGKPSAGDEAKFWRADGTWSNPSTGGDNWGTQVVQVTARILGNGTGGSPLDIAQQGATSGQVLKWNGSTWAPANDTDTDTDAQTLAIDSIEIATGQRFSLAISNGDTVYFENTDAQQIDTFAYLSGVLSLSVQRDGQPAKTVSIPVADGSETVVTAGTGIGVAGSGTTGSPYVVSNTGDLSASNEGILGVGAGASNTATLTSNTTGQTPVTVAGLTGISISETTSANGGTINITNTSPDQVVVIEGGPGIIVAESYPNFTITAIDTSFLNEIQTIAIDSSVLSYGQRFELSISGADAVYFEDEDRQQIDTFRVNAGNVELSAQRDAQQVKTIPVTDIAPVQGITAGSGISVSAGPNVTITNNGDLSNTNEIQQIDTFTIVGNTLRASLSLDLTPFRSVDLSPYLDNTDDQKADTFEIVSNVLRLSLESDAEPFRSVNLAPYLDNTDAQSLTYAASTGIMSISGGTGDTVNVMVGASAGTNGERGLVPKPVAGEEGAFLRGDGTWANPSVGGDNWGSQVVQVQPRLTGDGTGSSPLDIAQQGATSGQTLKWNGTTWVPDNDNDTDLQQIDTFRVNAGNVELSIQRDTQPAKTIPITSIAPVQAIAAGTGISVSGTSTVTVTNTGDLSNTNEIQQIDTFALVGNTLRASLSSDGVPFKSVDLTPYVNEATNLTYTGTSSPVTLNSSTGTDVTHTAGTGISISATSGNMTINNTAPDQTVSIANGGGVAVSGTYPSFTLTASDQSPTNEIQRMDTFEIVSNVLRASLLNDGVPFSSVNLAPYLDNTDDQKVDTFTLVGNVIRLSIESDGEPFKSVDLTPILSGGLNGIYGDGTAGTGSDTLPPGGSIVTIPGAWQPLTFRMNVPAASVRTAISVEIDSCSDDKVSKYLVGKSPIDSLEIYNFDCGAVIKETGGIMQIVTDRELYLTADSVSATAPTRTIAPYLLGQDASGFLRKIPGATSGQIMKWNGTNWALAADDAGIGTLDGAENGLNVVANKVRLGGTLLTATTIAQAGFDLRSNGGKWSHSTNTVSAFTPIQGFGVMGSEGNPTTNSTPTLDGIAEFRAHLSNVEQPNSLTIGAYTTDGQGMWVQARSRSVPNFSYPLQLNPRGGPVSIGRGTTIPTARFTVTATGATGSTASGMVGLFENTAGSGNVSVGFGTGSDVIGGQLMWNATADAMRITNRNATNGTSSVRIAVGGETSDVATFEKSAATSLVQFGVGTTTPHSTIQSAGSIATAYLETVGAPTFDETKRTVVYTANTNITWTLPTAAACACQGREYILHHSGTAGTVSLSQSVSKGNGSTFNSLAAGEWSYIIYGSSSIRGYKLTSL